MDLELTPDQARGIWRLRRRWPGADVQVHRRPWGVIVEVRRGRRAVALAGFDGTGGTRADVAIARGG